MKLFFLISQVYQLGGAEKLSFDLALSLHKRGYVVQVGLLYKHPYNVKNVELLKALGIKVSFFDMPIGSNKLSVFKYALRLRRLLLLDKIDIVETSTVIPSILLSLATFFTKIHCVFGVHQVYSLNREKSFNYKVYRQLISMKSSSQVYFISKFVEHSSFNFFKLKKHKTFILYNNIRDEFYSERKLSNEKESALRDEFSVSPSNRIILYCGRFASYKGVDIVYESSKPFLFDGGYKLIFLGAIDFSIAGTRKALENIKRDIASKCFQDKVLFLPHREDVRDIMLLADVLVHPTQIEGFGLSLVEALALNLPIVTSTAEAIPEILSGTTATLIRDFSVPKYSEAIQKALNLSEADKLKAKNQNSFKAEEYKEDHRVSTFVKEVLS